MVMVMDITVTSHTLPMVMLGPQWSSRPRLPITRLRRRSIMRRRPIRLMAIMAARVFR